MRIAFTLALVMLVLPLQLALAQTEDGHARPQRGNRAAVEFRVQHFTTADGLPSNRVSSIEEDSLGFLWLGTDRGLVRYDGYTFSTFLPRPNDSTSIGNSSISALHVDATGHLWAGSFDGLSRFNHEQEQFRHYRHDPEEPGSLIYTSSITSSPADPGVIWFGTMDWPRGQGGGLSRLDVTTGTITHYRHEPQEPGSLRSNLISCLLVSRDGTLWVGTAEGGLHRFDQATDSFKAFFPHPASAPEAWVNLGGSIYEDREGVLWVGTWGGLQRFDPERGSFTSFFPYSADPNSVRNRVHAIFEDRTGTLWIGTESGLYSFDRHTGRFTRFRHQPSPPYIQSIHEDQFGVLWVGTWDGGLMKLERHVNPFTIYQHDPENPNSLADDAVRPIYEDSRGILWVGSFHQLNRVDRRTGSVTRYAHDPKDPNSLSAVNEITSIYGDRAGTLWVAGCNGGLNRMDAEQPARFTRFQHDPDEPSSIGPGCVNPPLEDRAGNFWIAIFGGGIDRMDREKGTFRHYTRETHGLGDDGVFVLYEAPSEPGTLWVGTSQGVSRFDTKTEHFTNFEAENLRGTTMLHEDRAGRFWVATASNGLHLFDRQKGTSQAVYTTEEGLSHNIVKSILEDDQGFLWLGTSNGLSKFDPERRTFQNYDVRDGLPGNLFHEGAQGKSASGEVFFGGANGMVSFFPEAVVDNSAPPEVVLTGLQIAGRPVEIGLGSPLERSILVTEAVVLSHKQNDLMLEYVGLHSIGPAQHRYRYQLEGYDREWVEAGVQRTARYARLPPGEYVFRVRAANSDDVWNEEGASLHITVLPPWWRTWWAYTVYGMLFLTGVVAVDRVQRRRLIRRERQQAQQREAELLRAHEVELQARNAQLEAQKRRLVELDAVKARFFANLSHEFRTPLTLLLGPIDDALERGDGRDRLRHRLPVMQRNARRLLQLIDQLLDLAKLESGTMTLHARRLDLVAFVERLVEAFAARAEAERITLQFAPEVETCEAYADPDKLEKILSNLLSNAFKFTPEGGRIRLRLLVETATHAVVEVRDTGQGITPEELPRIFDRFHQVDASSTRKHGGVGIGLALAKELIELHKGRIEVESEVGFGTLIRVCLPLGQAHLPPGSVVEPAEAPLEAPAGEWMPEAGISPSRLLAYAGGDGAPEETPGEVPEDAPLVLIVEDNAELRAYIREHLAAAYRVAEAADGVEGLEASQRLVPDLVIADVMMPRMDGFALCHALREHKLLGHVPVILLTAKADEASKLEGLETGADDYLAKPFSMEELLVRVENLIELRRLLRQRFSGEVVLKPTGVTVPSQEAVFLEQVREAVEAHLGETSFGVDQLAEEVSLSARQLHRKMKALTKLTPAGYIRMMRLERAAQLLKQHAGTVSEVAYAVGFQDAYYFSRLFKQSFGVVPSVFAGDHDAL